MKRILQTVAFAAAMATATSAFAAPALVTSDLNLRTGPGVGYPVITAMPNGAIVDVSGCTRGYNWCRVDWRGYDGWAASDYLAQRTGGRVYSNYGAEIGVPLIAGAVIGGALLSDHHHRHYYHHDYHHHDYRHHGFSGHRGGFRGHHGSISRCPGGYNRHHGSC